MRLLPLVFALFTLQSCIDSDFDGYKRLDDSIHYKREFLGDDALAYSENSFVSFELLLLDVDDSLKAIKHFDRLTLDRKKLPNYLIQLISKSFQGDVISLIGDANQLSIPILFDSISEFKSDTVKLKLTITEFLSDEMLRARRAEERRVNDLELQEQSALASLLDSLHFDDSNYKSGIYFELLSSGRGAHPESGDHVLVNYQSKLIDGTIVDDTFKGRSLEYEIGRPDQVIKGFSIGVSMMNEGSRALMIIPSNLAFGEKGSSSGIVPPFTTVIYEVKLEKVGI